MRWPHLEPQLETCRLTRFAEDPVVLSFVAKKEKKNRNCWNERGMAERASDVHGSQSPDRRKEREQEIERQRCFPPPSFLRLQCQRMRDERAGAGGRWKGRTIGDKTRQLINREKRESEGGEKIGEGGREGGEQPTIIAVVAM